MLSLALLPSRNHHNSNKAPWNPVASSYAAPYTDSSASPVLPPIMYSRTPAAPAPPRAVAVHSYTTPSLSLQQYPLAVTPSLDQYQRQPRHLNRYTQNTYQNRPYLR